MTPTWIQLTLSISAAEPLYQEAWEVLCWEAVESGALGCEEAEQADPAHREAVFTFQAGGDPLADALEAAAREAFPGAQVISTRRGVRERDWMAPWAEYYAPTAAGERLYVGPPDQLPPAGAPAGSLYIPIAYAPLFGTGGHPTTRGCLGMIESLAAEYSSLLDIGTGTGVLCMAALRLGFEYAVGMDNDPACEAAFVGNARLNGCADRVAFLLGSTVEEATGGCLLTGYALPELLVCNMLSTVFDPLLIPLARLRRPMILSGFLVAEGESVRARLDATGWDVSAVTEIEEWGTWLCRPRTQEQG